MRHGLLTRRSCRCVYRYVESIIKLMDLGGDDVGDDVWHRAVHLMSNSEAMRARGTGALVARLEGGSYSVPLISTAGCAAPVLVYPSTAKVWQTLNIGESSRVPSNLIIFWSYTWSNVMTLFRSGLPNNTGTTVAVPLISTAGCAAPFLV